MSSPHFKLALRTRGYECDTSRSVPLPPYLSYMETNRWEWLDDPSFGLAELVAQGHFFVVRRQQVELLERVRYGVDLQVQGWLERVGRCRASVRHEISTADGTLVARAVVLGVWFGPGRTIGRIPPFTRAFDDPDAEWPALLVDPVTQPEHVERLRIRRSDCDMLGHVNATRYVDLFEDARQLAAASTWADDPAAAAPLRTVRISYDGETFAGDEVALEGARVAEGYLFALRRGEDVLCRALLSS